MKILRFSIFLFFVFCIASFINAKEILLNNGAIRNYTLYGYFNNDTLRDYMIKQFSEDKIYFEVYIKRQKGFEKSISSFFTSSIFSDEDFFKNADLYNDTKGGITIVGFCCGSFKTVENYYYEYNDKVQNWILNKKYTYSYNQDYKINYEIIFPTQSISINRIKFDEIKIQNDAERKIYYNDLLSDLLLKFSNANKNKINYSYLLDYPKFMILDMLNFIPVTSQNVIKYNDLAYYLQQTQSEDRNAQYILDEIITKFPNRTVAYINLGDAYWDLKEYDNARKYYGIYVKLMKDSNKENIIPQIILKRLKE